MILIKMQKSFLVIFEVFLRLNSDLLDMISCFVTAVNAQIINMLKAKMVSQSSWLCKSRDIMDANVNNDPRHEYLVVLWFKPQSKSLNQLKINTWFNHEHFQHKPWCTTMLYLSHNSNHVSVEPPNDIAVMTCPLYTYKTWVTTD